MMNTIYCLGDSHTWFFNNFPCCKTVPLGPRLAYNFGILVDSVCKIIDERVVNDKPEKFCVLFVLGEIDIRVHLRKHQNIKECVDNYVGGLCEVKSRGYHVAVFGAIASTKREDNNPENWGGFPVAGSCIERNKIAREFNSYLEPLCGSNNLKYFSILESLIDENGLTIEKYYSSSDRIHLADTAKELVEPFIIKLRDEEWK